MTADGMDKAWTLAWRLRYDKTPVTDIEIGEAARAIFDLLQLVENLGEEPDDD